MESNSGETVRNIFPIISLLSGLASQDMLVSCNSVELSTFVNYYLRLLYSHLYAHHTVVFQIALFVKKNIIETLSRDHETKSLRVFPVYHDAHFNDTQENVSKA